MIFRLIKHLFLPAIVIICFTTCKKYQENTVWFKSKAKLNLFIPEMKLTAYRVNGIDSLDALNSYFGWNSTTKEIRETHFDETYSHINEYHTVNFHFVHSYSKGYMQFTALYSKNMKHVTLYNNQKGDTSAPFKKFLFIDESVWQITKLIPNGTRKIKKTVNGNTYELQFDPY